MNHSRYPARFSCGSRRIHQLSEEEGRQYIIGMEHGNSKRGVEGEAAVIQAYREVDVQD